MVVGLTLGMAYGQEQTDSVQSVMNELSAYQGVKPAAPVAATPVAVKPVAVAVESAPAVMVAEPAPVAVVAAPVDVPAVLEVSREQYVAGDYAKAEAGFLSVLAADPENKVAAFFLRQFSKKNHRVTEETAIQAVDQAWGMILRYYPVSDRFVKGMGLEGVKEVTDVVPQFSAVDFPKGSSALYLPDLHKLFVKNTPANLVKLEQILGAFSVAEGTQSEEQVKIETRFVEFNEGALQELGFNWTNPNDINRGDWSVNSVRPDGDPQNLFSDAMRSLPYSQTGAIGSDMGIGETRVSGPGTTTRIEDTFNSQATGPGKIGFSGKVGGDNIDLLISALDQSSGVDVLSAPSVTTLSGQSAFITVGERHFYPETYEAGTSQGTVLHVKYEDFKEKLLGVEMTVTPTIKGDDIQMKINPKITELLGWQSFELAAADTSYTYYQYRIGQQFQHETVIAKLPLFNRREVKTEVSAASGATIGMGGLIGEKTEAFSDRVPVLGSIPLVGRLFRTEGNRTIKRNLMIFVTASKVSPSGRIVSERSFDK
jgi:type II secretory pathway component GspD/PulD (secretin)